MQNRADKALAYLQAGQGKKAYQEAKSALKAAPAVPGVHNIAGMALGSLGRHAEAARHFLKATQLAPEFIDARRNLAQALILAGQHDKARKILTGLLDKTPTDEAGWYLLAQCNYASARLNDAETAACRALELAPGTARSLNLRASIREKQGDLPGALDDYETALRADPDNVEALVNISMPLARALRGAEALEAVRKAIRLAPTHPGARRRFAMHLLEEGRSKDAIQAFQDVLDLDPTDGLALEQLSHLLDAGQNKALKPQVIKALKTAPKASEHRASLFYALAHMARKDKDLGQETSALTRANGEMHALLPYDRKQDEDWERRICTRFSEPITEDLPRSSTPRPIYVLGLPRSGTTLAEAILGAHPRVRPLGERAAAGILLKEVLDHNLAFDAEAFRAGDAALLPELAPDVCAYVDKMPENYRLIGFLKTAYPESRIINMIRDPHDIALSMWRGHFSGSGLNYTYDLRAMASRFNIYARMMRHWHDLLPGQILDLRYEDLVRDLPATGRKMAAFCDLDWHDAMAAPHENTGQVLTLSANQIRQPVHARSVGGWRPYEAALADFTNGLDPELWAEPPG